VSLVRFRPWPFDSPERAHARVEGLAHGRP
jgi:hypothetical protein